MKKEQQQFLALLRAGLWNTPADATLFSETTNWDNIIIRSNKQTVLGVVAEGVNTLPAEYQPPTAISNKMLSRVLGNIQGHSRLNSTLAEVTTMLYNNDVHPVLLKGQGVAMNYIEPTRRQCGDIDLYIGKKDYDRACALMNQHYDTDSKSISSEKHYHCQYNSVTIELHRIAEQLPSPWQNKRFQNWTLQNLHGDRLRSVEIEGVEIKLPPVNFDTLYIFNHIWHHFAGGGGVGLRQLCDWVRYLHTFQSEINHNELEHNLKAFGLFRSWRIFGYIAVDALGLPQNEFPFYEPSYANYGKTTLEMIEHGGNFGFSDTSLTNRPKGYIKGKLHALRWKHKRFWRLLPIFSVQILSIWNRFIYSAIRQIIKDKFHKI